MLLLVGCGGSSAGESLPASTAAPVAALAATSLPTVAPPPTAASASSAASPAASPAAGNTTATRASTASSAASTAAGGTRAAGSTPTITRAATGATGQATAAVAPGTLFKDPKGRFSFVPDASWKDASLGGAFVARFTDETSVESFTVQANAAPTGLTLDQVVDQQINDVLKKNPLGYDPGPKGKQPTMLGGEPARSIDYSFMTSGVRASFTRIYCLKSGVVYEVAIQNQLVSTRQAETQARADTFNAQADPVLKSWKFL